ncbi:hypothetical protein V1L54_23535 [Streptomyces sp. TRM 70361]|uniref:WXG100 family type VII secretion target n=1 Tax=Streptomyces sp. TRM 70361 TaxID=3116553 RepID=UPI002E7B1797|nr:hypothetical protein [Streptomyces sp. TRM 70361]MEE1942337.1 hypothetical protein [Streptomyces sp. TRM 70361]
MATGEFEGKSLAALHAMVSKANPGLLSSRGHALSNAGSDLDGIGSELRAYIDRVKWEGQGAESFREWGQQFALESMRFAAYVRTLGNHMVNASQALTEAKAAVPAPNEMCYADPEKDRARQEAEEKKRQEAINQLNRLSSYYRMAGESMRAAEEPNFAAPPGDPAEFGSAGASGNTGTLSTAASAGTRDATSYRESSTAPDKSFSTYGSGVGGTEARSSSVANHPSPVTDRHTNTTLDSVTLPSANEVRPQTANPAPQQSSNGPSTLPVAPVPSTGPAQRADRLSSRAPVTGTSPVGRPQAGGGNGITGGTSRPVGNLTPGIPRGPVIGGEHPSAGRPVGGYPGGMGNGTPANNGTHAGRPPMASQPGGTAGTPRASSGRREFTPGGTGLVRGGGTAPGMAARPATTNPPPDNRRRGPDRPDYLAEDEETWAAGQRNVVPPVID